MIVTLFFFFENSRANSYHEKFPSYVYSFLDSFDQKRMFVNINSRRIRSNNAWVGGPR